MIQDRVLTDIEKTFIFVISMIMIFVLFAILTNVANKIRLHTLKLMYSKNELCLKGFHEYKNVKKSKNTLSSLTLQRRKCTNCKMVVETRMFASSESDPFDVVIKPGNLL